MEQIKTFTPFSICCGSRLLQYARPAVMGILNVTPDSFYDGGRYRSDCEILKRVELMLSEGADIIDVGVVSTRPGAQLLPPDEEAARLGAVVELVRGNYADAVISVDTCFSEPAKRAVEMGADIVNDISGGEFDEKMFETVASLHVPYILMHNRAKPDKMQQLTHYDDIVSEMVLYLSAKIDTLHQLGVRDVIIDPGFGFAKTLEGNYEVMAHLSQFRALFPNVPLLVALSRKSMIYKLLGTDAEGALCGTTVLHALSVMQGAQMLRVHDVKEARQTIDVVMEVAKYVG